MCLSGLLLLYTAVIAPVQVKDIAEYVSQTDVREGGREIERRRPPAQASSPGEGNTQIASEGVDAPVGTRKADRVCV